MRETLLIECAFCRKSVEKLMKNVNARLKLGGDQKFYCDRKCAASKLKESVACGACGSPIERTTARINKSKSGESFCDKSCAATKNNMSRQWKGELHPNYIDGGSSYRTSNIKDECEGCGEDQDYLLVVHHRDGDRDNNTKDNLETVCWNCHALRHLIVKDGKLVVRWNALTTLEAKQLLEELRSRSLTVGRLPVEEYGTGSNPVEIATF